MKKKIILVSIFLIFIVMFGVTNIWAALEDTCNVSIQTDSTEIAKTQTQVKITVTLNNYEGDGILGYEGKLEYDKNVFEDATITALNDWETVNYEKTTGMFLSTTTKAVAGTQVAQITLDLKSGVTATETTVSITGLTFSDSETQKTFAKTFTYTFPYNVTQEQPDTPNSNEEVEDNKANVLVNQTINVVTNSQVANNNGITNTVQDITVEAVAGSNRDKTTASTTIPQTGAGIGYIIVFAVIAVVGIGAYIRYRSIPLK